MYGLCDIMSSHFPMMSLQRNNKDVSFPEYICHYFPPLFFWPWFFPFPIYFNIWGVRKGSKEKKQEIAAGKN